MADRLEPGAKQRHVLNLLLAGKSLSQLDLQKHCKKDFRLYTTRLGAVIFELRKKGHPIEVINKPMKHTIGTYAVYFMRRENRREQKRSFV